MSKVLSKSQLVMKRFEEKGKKFLKSGLHDYVAFIVFFFGSLYLSVKSLMQGLFFKSLVFFVVCVVILVIVFFGRRVLVKIGELQSKI